MTCLEEVWTELDCGAQETARNSGQHSQTKLPPADSQTHILSLKFKERVLGICVLYDKFCNITAFAPLLRCFWLNLCSLVILGILC